MQACVRENGLNVIIVTRVLFKNYEENILQKNCYFLFETPTVFSEGQTLNKN